MKNGNFAISVHILSILAWEPQKWKSSEYMAESLNINPVLVRKELGNLKHFGLVESKEGKHGGSRLLKSASEILLSDVFLATKKVHVFSFAKNEPSHECPIGKSINSWLDQLYMEIDNEIENKLRETTLKDFLEKMI